MNAQIFDISVCVVIIIIIGLCLWYKSYFLDELPEFSKTVLETLRQPLEDRVITISRAQYSIQLPCSIMLVAAMNPCPCGYYNDPNHHCDCTPGQIKRYMSRVSGPFLDRMDCYSIDYYTHEFRTAS